jgi:NodT family efflux transporter outer membrane factor (OMF) lipoprotein
MKRVIYIIAVTLLLGSCAVKYQQPQVDTEHLIRGAEVTDTTFDIAKVDWREFYKDPYLTALIDSALANNLDMKEAIARIEQASSYLKQSKATLFPSLNASASAGYSKPNLGSDPSPYFSLGANLSWELDIWGKLSSAKRGKYEALLAQESTKNAVRTKLISEIAKAYYSLLILDTEKEFVIQTIRNREEYLATVKELKKAAQTTEVAVLQAEAQLLLAKTYIPDIENTTNQTENAISLLLGITPRHIERGKVETIDDIHFPQVGELGIPANLLRNRPDVLAAEHQLKSALEGFNTAKAAMYPSLKITGNVSSDAAQISQWFAMPGSLVYGILGGLTQPIFNARSLHTQKEVAYQNYRIAAFNFQESVLTAGVEVSNAVSAIAAGREKVLYLTKQTMALEKAYEYSVELLINGYANYLDVLSAQEGYFSAKINLMQGLQRCINNNIDLYRALGGGWN